jgi:pimeloyl-ACP methyl ester carboxylesterase
MISPAALVVCLSLPVLAGTDDPKPTQEIQLSECLTLARGGGRGGRVLIAADPVAAAIVSGRWLAPKEGDEVTAADGTRTTWKSAKANAEGSFQGAGFAGGYAFVNVPSETERVMILEASGHAMVTVNGEPRAGDPYGYGYVKLPVLLRKGDNAFLFRTGRGQLKARLIEPRSDCKIETGDVTLPDLLVGREIHSWASVVVLNATKVPLEGLKIVATIEGGESSATILPTLLPLSARKVAFRLAGPGPIAEGDEKVHVAIEKGTTLDRTDLSVRVRNPDQTHKRTFLSGIDGSVQYFGLVPAKVSETSEGPRPGLILTLHGASVEGIGQAAVYAPKSWAHVVAPTNRRPYGFDWEDWGRLDAIEVLELAQRELDTDPRRTWLTGHSMGGHGAWHLGVTFPDRFAAVGPSAGWVSMASYAGARPIEKSTGVDGILRRGMSPSDTTALAANLTKLGVYVLHGSADDNVPVGQARQMRTKLAEFHPDFAYHEQAGAGHWWGNECCDWPPLIEFLKAREIPERKNVKAVDFITASPSVSASCHWATVEAQQVAFRPSVVHLKLDDARRQFSGTTENVQRLALDVSHLMPGPIEVVLDGQTFPNLARPEGDRPRLWLHRDGQAWSSAGKPSLTLKGPHRSGPFKDAFRNRVMFVYGTRGTLEENAWSLAKARFDAERFWYQGNASVDVVPDSGFDPSSERERNVIVYGHGDMNSAWNALLEASPVQVSRGKLVVGDREKSGDDLACLFVRPRPGSDQATVGVVAGTGPAGLRLAGVPSYFTSGVAYPDCIVLRPEGLTKGLEGIVAAGYFGEDWSVRGSGGEFTWRCLIYTSPSPRDRQKTRMPASA